MTDETAFVCALEQSPEDTALRLVFSDWLQERGDPRGEVLQLTHTLTQATDVPHRPELEARLQALLRQGVQPVGPYWTNDVGIRFAWIPAGTFLMGSPAQEAERKENELQHQVVLTRGYWLGTYPVTQEQWQQVMGNNPSRFSDQGNQQEKGWNRLQKDTSTSHFPAERIDWEQAMEFCSRLGQVGPGVFTTYRLPTEAEWEYACRAGTQTPFHFGAACNGSEANCAGKYPYGTSKKRHPVGRPTEVGKYLANAFGLYDMHGNVWEWCMDWYGEYDASCQQDPRGPQRGSKRVFRGGDCFARPSSCRSAFRRSASHYTRISPEHGSQFDHNLGFRPALVPSGS
jgi:uncharacterized protein (TIGR02996 family)